MFNSEIEKALLNKCTTEEYKIFCKLEAEKNKLLEEDRKIRNINDFSEFTFEANWYEKRFNELNEKL